RSDEIVTRFASRHSSLRLVRFGGRNGKIRIVNHLAEEATAGFADQERAVFILCDANVSWAPTNLRRLVRHFRREEVGLVGSAVTDLLRDHAGIGDQEEAYVGQENRVKFAEGVLWGRVMGAFGACYALRATLFRPVPPHYIVDDFFQTLACLEQGRDAIVDLEAVCHEAVSVDIREEFRRKRRIAAGNFQNLRHFRSFLRPWNGGWVTAFAFWSHKGLRWCGPFLLLAATAACAVLACLHWVYLVCLAGIAAGGAMAWIDRAGGRHVKLFRFARYFLSMNAALLLGFLDFLKGPRGSVWEPTRREVSASPEGGDRAGKRPAPVLRR
ncbi:MAG TPA: glycosyltransferase, partial [Bacteroidia bacterium]|nr:glycosyltransferase [Bacteroidia bacterium]